MNTPIDLTMTNLRLIVQSARDHWPKLRLVLKACTTMALLVAGLIFALRGLSYADTPNKKSP